MDTGCTLGRLYSNTIKNILVLLYLPRNAGIGCILVRYRRLYLTIGTDLGCMLVRYDRLVPDHRMQPLRIGWE